MVTCDTVYLLKIESEGNVGLKTVVEQTCITNEGFSGPESVMQSISSHGHPPLKQQFTYCETVIASCAELMYWCDYMSTKHIHP